jgi:hypothetical protein
MSLLKIKPFIIDDTTASDAFVQANAAFDHANASYISQNTTASFANGAFDRANSGYGVANSAGVFANAAFVTANSGASFANASFITANSAASFANGAFVTANSGSSFANGAFVTANSSASFANASFITANSAASFANGAFDRANAAYAQANTGSPDSWARDQANSAYDSQNTTSEFANASFEHANAAFETANGVQLYVNGDLFDLIVYIGDKANNTAPFANSGFNTANSGFDAANSAASFANGAFITANSAYAWGNHAAQGYATQTYVNTAIADLVNSAPTTLDTLNELAAALGDDANFSTTIATTIGVTNSFANGAFLRANASYDAQNTTATFANAAFTHSNSAYNTANSGASFANGAFIVANSAASFANSAFDRANSAYDLAADALPAAGGTITGDLTVTGNVNFVSNVTSTLITGNTGQFFGYDANGFNALYAGIPEGYTIVPNEVAQFTGSNNSYIQINFQNLNGGSQGTTDWIATANNGTDTSYYVDLGIAGSGYDNQSSNNSLGTSLYPNDSYLYSQGNYDTPSAAGGNLVIGTATAGKVLRIIAGGVHEHDVVMSLSEDEINVNRNIIISSANVSLGQASNVEIYGGSSGYILSTDGSGNLSWIDSTPNTVTYTANSLIQTNGVYVSGNLACVQTFGDYATGNVYILTDGTGSAPAWYIDFDFIDVVSFNRVVMNINYNQSSGHTVYIQLYNNSSSQWDNIGTYTGLGSYYAFALDVIDETNYVDGSNKVQLRLYHSNAGASTHQTSIDYVALEQSYQGPQGPRGPTGATGATGATGNGIASGGTTGQILIKNSSTDYDTAWSNNLILSWNHANAAYNAANTGGGGGSGSDTWARAQANAAYEQANTASNTANAITGNIAVNIDNFTGDGSCTAFTMSTAPTDANNVIINVNGVIQLKEAYTVTANSTTLTLSSAPAVGAKVDAIIFKSGAVSSSSGGTTRAQAMTMGILFGG